MKKIRFGLTGSGYMGRTHAEAIKHLSNSAELVAIWGGTRAPALAARLGAASEPTLEALVARSDIDAIVITTPHATHHREAMAALAQGKHLLIEKPITTTLADCDELLAAAAARNLVITTGYTLRFRVNLPLAREIVASGAIGTVQSLHFSMIRQLANAGNFGGNKTGWINQPEAIGFVIDGLPHGIDAIRWITGAEAVRVVGFSRTYSPGRVIEDTSVGAIEFSNGAICSVHTTQASHGDYHGEMAHLMIMGSKGSLDIDHFGAMHQTDREKGWRRVSTQPSVAPDDPEMAFKGGRMEAYYDQIRSFIDGIQGRPMRGATGKDGRDGLAVCLALLQSSREQRIISIV